MEAGQGTRLDATSVRGCSDRGSEFDRAAGSIVALQGASALLRRVGPSSTLVEQMRAAANRQVRERGPIRETAEPDPHRNSPHNDHRAPSDDRNRSITDDHHIASELGQAGLVWGAAHSAIADSRRFGLGRRDYAVCGLGLIDTRVAMRRGSPCRDRVTGRVLSSAPYRSTHNQATCLT